ncbi:ZIP family metal transporter [Marivita sp. S2033]|uniref:ZIP family metal transporter n=1 Tax=Marivita sp. S2033 TaxID=3373187 RepID=UPI0039825E9F
MSDLIKVILLTSLAGSAIPLGAYLAGRERFVPHRFLKEFQHAIIAFGGGALLSAIALVLVPEGIDRLPAVPSLLAFGAGGLVFGFLDHLLSRREGRLAQFMAMMLDYIPEAMALGAMMIGQSSVALLLAGLIALQNLPEGYNAWNEMTTKKRNPKLLAVFIAMVPAGAVAAVVGLTILGEAQAVLGAIMLFSAGGILYLLFEDIAPQVPIAQRWAPPMGAVMGFMLGLAGHLAIG